MSHVLDSKLVKRHQCLIVIVGVITKYARGFETVARKTLWHTAQQHVLVLSLIEIPMYSTFYFYTIM